MLSLNVGKQFHRYVLLIVCVFASSLAGAIEVTKNLYLPVGFDFDTNIAMGQIQKKDVVRLIVNPRLLVLGEDETDAYTLDASFFATKSSDQMVSEDRRDPSADLGWRHTFERGMFSINGLYRKQSIRSSELTRSGLLFLDLSSVTRAVNANLDYQLSDKFVLDTGVAYLQEEFTGNALTGFNNKNLNFRLNHLYNEKITPFYAISFSRFTNEELGSKIGAQMMNVGVDYLFSERLRLNFAMGLNKIDDTGKSWIGSSSVSYNLNEHSAMNATISRNVMPGGLGGFQKSDDLALDYTNNFSSRDALGINYTWSINRTINDAESMQLSGWYERQIVPEWSLRVTAQQRYLKFSENSFNGSQLAVSLIYSLLNF